ncbi:DDE-type integrase/transposase/recombinase [Domibacillus indicus]|uniref:DDE-type integrase/transposase/recombinase n=1 Tax=Domibacillus indicus TaxID=1437523 RepID=UPI0009E62E62
METQFHQTKAKKVVVSDLTFIKVKNKWHYVCIFVDLFNREIIGFSTGPNKDAGLVARTFSSIQGDLRDIQLFHTDRGSEFKNQLIDETLPAFQIGRSLKLSK